MEGFQKKLVGEEVTEYSLAEVLRIFSFGSEMRQALERIAKSHRGALIVLSEKARDIAEGGFNINSKFTSQKLAELAKMDGAIITDSRLKKILYANALLVPDSKIKSKETGTKHKAAERTAKQLGVIVIAVSEKSSQVSVYYGSKEYTLNEMTELMYKGRETIENLEGQREEINDLLKRFDSLEISSIVTIEDLAQIINKLILFFKDCEIASIYIAELGKYGETLRTRFNVVMSGLRDELDYIQKDYENYFFMPDIIKLIKSLKTPTLEQSVKIMRNFIRKEQNNQKNNFAPIGYRILSKTQIHEEVIEKLVQRFKNVKSVLYAEIGELINIEGLEEKQAKLIKDFLENRMIFIQ